MHASPPSDPGAARGVAERFGEPLALRQPRYFREDFREMASLGRRAGMPGGSWFTLRLHFWCREAWPIDK